MNTRSMFVVLAAVLTAAVPVEAKLKEGDPAPPMKVSKWVKGAPVTRFTKGKVYVVEFWATWCGPCRATIPHLTELARKHKGAVTFAGIDIWEREKGTARTATVTRFVRDMGTKMGYSVGMDDDAGTMAKTWMAAAGQNGIPAAFAVGKNGRIAWIGHPTELDKVLPQIVKGTYSVQAEARKKAAFDAMVTRVQKAAQASNFRGAVVEIDRFRASNPGRESEVAIPRYTYLMKYDVSAAMKYAERLANGIYRNDAAALNYLAYSAVEDRKGPRVRDYPIILTMAKRANALTYGKDANILDTLAAVYANSGDMAKALATQELAVSILDKNVPDEQRKMFLEHLAEYKAKKAG